MKAKKNMKGLREINLSIIFMIHFILFSWGQAWSHNFVQDPLELAKVYTYTIKKQKNDHILFNFESNFIIKEDPKRPKNKPIDFNKNNTSDHIPYSEIMKNW